MSQRKSLRLLLVAAELQSTVAEGPFHSQAIAERGRMSPLPYLAVAAGFAIVLYKARHESGDILVLFLAALAITLLVVGRQVLALRENAQLRAELDRLALLEERDRIARELHDGIVQAQPF